MHRHGRRRFLRGSLALAGASLLAGCAPPPFPPRQPRIPRVGLLSFLTPAAGAPQVEAFRDGLRDLGYVEGRDIVLEPRFTEGQTERYPELAAELVRLEVSAIVAQEPSAIRAVRQASDTIPVVMAGGSEIPVERGLIDSLARPGGRVTGVTYGTPDLPAKRLELLRGAVPGLARVAFIGGEAEPIEANPKVSGLTAAARALGLQLELVSLRSQTPPEWAPREPEEVFAELARKQVGGFVMDGAALASNNRARIAELAIRQRLPSIWSTSRDGAGGLLAYGANGLDLWRRAATHVDKLLKGARPADLPVEFPTVFDFVINLPMAGALGLTIPETLLQQATELIQ